MELNKKQIRIIISKLNKTSISYKCPLCEEKLLFKHFKSHTSKVHRGCDVKKLQMVVLQSINTAIEEKSKVVSDELIAKDKVHIVDVSANLAIGNQASVKSMATQLGWKTNPEDFLQLLQRIGVNVTTQLDVVTDEAKQKLAEYYGYNSFSEYISENHPSSNNSARLLKLKDVAEKLLINPQELMRKLIVENAKTACERLVSKNVITVSNACILNVSLVKQCLQTSNKNISNYYNLSDIEIDLFLDNLKTVNWNLWRNIPEKYLPIVDKLLSEFEQINNRGHIQSSIKSQTTKKSIIDKYSNLSLTELGRLYQNGNNDELDDFEKDVIKELINKMLNLDAI
jgi:hypothetical protein